MEAVEVKSVLNLVPELLDVPYSRIWTVYDKEVDVLHLNFKKPSHADDSESAEVALELHHRAEKSSEWEGSVPPATMGIVAKAYRAKAKEHKKNREIEQAISLFQKLVDMNLATDNDQKLLEKLQVSGKKQ